MFVDYEWLQEQLRRDGLLFLDDGQLALKVKAVNRDTGVVECVAENAWQLGERKGVHLPGVSVRLPAVSDKDRKDISFARANGLDFVFASFVRTPEHVHEVRELAGPSMRVISKIETQEAVDNFKDILAASDGIMVARGDLGVDIPLERLFLVQKRLIAMCNAAGKPVITATQMLESMVNNPRPTRAECVDVANAVLDGSDAVMLSGETAKGSYPVLAASTMGRICQVAEAAVDDHEAFLDILHQANYRVQTEQSDAKDGEAVLDPVESLAAAAVHASYEQRGVKMIVVLTHSGRTAHLVAKYRPRAPILAMTPSDATARHFQLTRGIHALMVGEDESVDTVLDRAQAAGLAMGLCAPGDRFLALLGHGNFMQAGDVSSLHVVHVKDRDDIHLPDDNN